jgi:hypothetical protein
MFGKGLKKLSEDVTLLKQQVNSLIQRTKDLPDTPVIGEVFCEYAPVCHPSKSWIPFGKHDIIDKVDGYIKITLDVGDYFAKREVWVPDTQILLYSDIHKERRAAIEKMVANRAIRSVKKEK